MVGEPESLEQDEDDLVARDRRHAYDRTIMLSDGVFAIAITLLAFDIRPPEDWNSHFDSLWRVIGPELTAYALGFVAISFFWLLHRRLVALIAEVDALAMALNLLMLGFVALLPASTRVAEHGSPAEPSGLIFNAGLVMAIGAALSLLWGYAAFVRRSVFARVDARARWTGLFAPVLAPAIMLGPTSGLGLPPHLVPVVLVVMFAPIWLVVQRLIRTPAARAKAADPA